jgi:hypothetical protein
VSADAHLMSTDCYALSVTRLRTRTSARGIPILILVAGRRSLVPYRGIYPYVNWRGHRGRWVVTIHVGGCRDCNHGEGQRGGTDPHNGFWEQRCDSLPDAERVA